MLTTHDVKNCKVGDIVNIANIDWRVANRTEDKISFVSDKTLGSTIWNAPHMKLCSATGMSEIYTVSRFADSIAYYSCLSVYVLLHRTIGSAFLQDKETGVFVHLPTYAQLTGGWQLFKTNIDRICVDKSGFPRMYWTSSANSFGRIAYVDHDGNIDYDDDPFHAYELRPVFTIRIK